MIAVCMPSRGLIHSRTMEHVFNNLKGYEYELFFTHSLPIPDCFNELTTRALESGADYLWFVEEDMYFPNDTLDKLLAADTPVATIDYPVSPSFNVWLEENGLVQRFGTGCTLVEAEIFETIGKTWRSDVDFLLPDWKMVERKGETYGQHDVEFAQRCKQVGIEVKCVGQGNQYRLKEMGNPKTNKGWHEIRTIL